jgi:hypothetical protein
MAGKKKARLTAVAEARNAIAIGRWRIFLEPMNGVWYEREVPQLNDDGLTLCFAADVAEELNQRACLVFTDQWSLWFTERGVLSHITARSEEQATPPFAIGSDTENSFIALSDQSADERW